VSWRPDAGAANTIGVAVLPLFRHRRVAGVDRSGDVFHIVFGPPLLAVVRKRDEGIGAQGAPQRRDARSAAGVGQRFVCEVVAAVQHGWDDLVWKRHAQELSGFWWSMKSNSAASTPGFQ